MLTHPGKSRPDRNARNGLELHEIDNGHVAVGGGDVSGEMQVRPKERWSMLAEQQDDPADSQRHHQRVNTEVLGPVHDIRLSLSYVVARYIVPTPGCSLRPPGFYPGSRRGSGPPIFWNCGIVPCIEEKSKAAHLESASDNQRQPRPISPSGRLLVQADHVSSR